jgi:hypothetical protein
MKTASKPNRTAKPIITSVLARTAGFLFDAAHFSLLTLVIDIGCRKVLMRNAERRFFPYAEKKLNRYYVRCVYALAVRLE